MLNKDLSKKAKSIPKQIVKDKHKCKKDSDSDSEYLPSETDTSSDSDSESDCESSEDEVIISNVKKTNKKIDTKTKIKEVNNMKDKKNDKMNNNIIILSTYPNEPAYDEDYDSDYVSTSDSGSENEEHEDVSVSSSSSDDSDDEEDEDEDEEENDDDEESNVKSFEEEDEKLIKYMESVSKKRKYKAPNAIINPSKKQKKSVDVLENIVEVEPETKRVNMMECDFKLNMSELVTQNQNEVRNTILSHFKEINKVVKDKLIDEQIQNYEKSMIVYQKKMEKKEKKTSEKHGRIFSKLIKEKSHMNDMKMYKKYPVKQQYEIIKKLREINELSIVDKPYRLKLIESSIPVIYKSTALKKINQLRNMDPASGEYSKLKNWIDMFMNIPFEYFSKLDVTKEDSHDFLEKSYSVLNEAVYGLDDAKIQLIQLMGQLIVNPSTIGCSIAINGPPGTGKTSLIKEGVSKILNRPFIFIPLGGATDSSFLEGHSYTYEGSTCGKIVQSIIDCKCMNPVIYFDELDKISDSPKGAEILNLLVHITDTTQNCQFHDKYFREIEFDLSKCLFIFSYNEEANISPILLDRMYKIKTGGYSAKEKIHIVNNYLSPSIGKQMAFTNNDIIIKDDVLMYIIEKFTMEEKGVRNVKRCIEIIYSKLNLFRLMKPGVNIFKQQIDLDVSFPFEVTRNNVDKLIKINTGSSIYKHMYI
jgi:ATP-dependent Lon protease